MSVTAIIITIIIVLFCGNLLRIITNKIEGGEQEFHEANLELENLDLGDEKPLTQLEFRDRVAAKIKIRNPNVGIEETGNLSLTLSILDDNSEAVIANLQNAYSQYLEDPEHGDEHIFLFVDLVMEALFVADGHDLEISQEQLGVVLRHKDYLNYLDLEKSVWIPFYGDLISVLVFYSPSFIVNASVDDLDKLSLDKTTAWPVAAQNLENQYDDLETVSENQGSKLITAQSGLATGHLWLLSRGTCGTNFNAMVINKKTYLFAEMSDEAATQILAGYAAHLVDIGDTLSGNLVSCVDGYFYASSLSNDTWQPIEN